MDSLTIMNRKTAPNWRFGASGGVTPQKVQWEYERLCPA